MCRNVMEVVSDSGYLRGRVTLLNVCMVGGEICNVVAEIEDVVTRGDNNALTSIGYLEGDSNRLYKLPSIGICTLVKCK